MLHPGVHELIVNIYSPNARFRYKFISCIIFAMRDYRNWEIINMYSMLKVNISNLIRIDSLG